jgi:hypothetical protein
MNSGDFLHLTNNKKKVQFKSIKNILITKEEFDTPNDFSENASPKSEKKNLLLDPSKIQA